MKEKIKTVCLFSVLSLLVCLLVFAGACAVFNELQTPPLMANLLAYVLGVVWLSGVCIFWRDTPAV